jgi:type II secretory pathway pseudopilin PulG
MCVTNKKRQAGFSMVEMLLAVSLTALVVQGIIEFWVGTQDKRYASRTIGAVDEITSSLYSYRVDDVNKIGGVGAWPADLTALIPYLPNNDPRTGNGDVFALAPVTTVTGPTYSITIPTSNENEANIIAANYTASSTVQFDSSTNIFNVVRIVQRPGGETSNNQFVLKDGTRDVDGNLTFNSGATFKNGGATVAEITPAGDMEAARFEQLTNTGNLLHALELKASGGGTVNPDIYGQSNTLVLGSGAGDNELVINNGEVQVSRLVNVGPGSLFESDTAIIKDLTVEQITIQ